MKNIELIPLFQFHKGEVVGRYELANSKARIKTVTNSAAVLLAMLSYHYTYNKRKMDERLRPVIAAG